MHHNVLPLNHAGFPHHQILFVFRHMSLWLHLCLEDDAFTQCENWLVWLSLTQITRWCSHVLGILYQGDDNEYWDTHQWSEDKERAQDDAPVADYITVHDDTV